MNVPSTYMLISITMYVLFIQTNDEAVKALYTLAATNYLAKPYGERDAGFDLASAETTVEGRNGIKISQLVSAAVFDTKLNQFRAYWMLPRSSISKTPLRLANSVGLIDAGYRGTLLAVVDNNSESFSVKHGDRLFQLSSPDLLPFDDIQIVNVIPGGETLRGAGGFGSTGHSYFT